MQSIKKAAELMIARPDSLVIFGRGLGSQIAIEEFLKMIQNKVPCPLVFIVGASESDLSSFKLSSISADCAPTTRSDLYNKGGVYAITGRILLTDLLTHRLVSEAITGIVIVDVERAGDLEYFCVRKFREKNRKGFLLAVSERPDRIGRSEDLLKNLFLQDSLLFPRFHTIFKSNEPLTGPSVERIVVPGSSAMNEIINQLSSLMAHTMKALKKFPDFSGDLDSLENLQDFIDKIKFSRNGNQAVGILMRDLIGMNSALSSLGRSDSVGFYKYWKELMTVNQSKGWMLSSEAEMISRLARKRVTKNIDVNPKFKALHDLILTESNNRSFETAKRIKLDSLKIFLICADERQKVETEKCLNFGPNFAALDTAKNFCNSVSDLKAHTQSIDDQIADCRLSSVFESDANEPLIVKCIG